MNMASFHQQVLSKMASGSLIVNRGGPEASGDENIGSRGARRGSGCPHSSITTKLRTTEFCIQSC